MKVGNNAGQPEFILFRKKRSLLIAILILVILISILMVYEDSLFGKQQNKNEITEAMEITPLFHPVDNIEPEEGLDFSNAEILNNVLNHENVYKIKGSSAALGTAYYYFVKKTDDSYELLCSTYAMSINELDIDGDGMAEIAADVYSVSPNVYIYAIQNGNVAYADLQESARADYVEFDAQAGVFLSHIKVNGEDRTYLLNLVMNN